MAISFSNEEISFTLKNKSLLKKWISEVISFHQKRTGVISYLFCNDERVHDVNLAYLDHDTYTDIITFDYVEGNLVSGDIVISIDRVKENAHTFNVPFEQELHRVIIHGVLHLLGFKDKSESDAALMRSKEDECLKFLETLTE